MVFAASTALHISGLIINWDGCIGRGVLVVNFIRVGELGVDIFVVNIGFSLVHLKINGSQC